MNKKVRLIIEYELAYICISTGLIYINIYENNNQLIVRWFNFISESKIGVVVFGNW